MDNFDELMKTKWTTKLCPAGLNCWCRGITTDPPQYRDNDTLKEDQIMIISTGQIDREYAEHIVKIHNLYVEGEQK